MLLLLNLQAKTYRSWYFIWSGFYDLYCNLYFIAISELCWL